MNTIPRTKVGLHSPLLYRLEGNDGSQWKGWGQLWPHCYQSSLHFSCHIGQDVCLFGFGILVFLTMQGYSLVTRGTLCLWCVGFSLGWLLLLQSRDSRHLGSVAADHLLCFPKARGSFQPGTETMSPALVCGFLSTGPQGKSYVGNF